MFIGRFIIVELLGAASNSGPISVTGSTSSNGVVSVILIERVLVFSTIGSNVINEN